MKIISEKIFTLKDLEVYKLSRELSKIAWGIYQELDWQIKKIIGDQFIEATDSVGSNIAEGYGRFHYLDRVKFLYNSRGSLLESRHFFELLKERKLIKNQDLQKKYLEIYIQLRPKLNGLIESIYKNKSPITNNK